MTNLIKITLHSQGGVLDCRTAFAEPNPDKAISDAVMDIALNNVISIGDTITIEEISE